MIYYICINLFYSNAPSRQRKDLCRQRDRQVHDVIAHSAQASAARRRYLGLPDKQQSAMLTCFASPQSFTTYMHTHSVAKGRAAVNDPAQLGRKLG